MAKLQADLEAVTLEGEQRLAAEVSKLEAEWKQKLADEVKKAKQAYQIKVLGLFSVVHSCYQRCKVVNHFLCVGNGSASKQEESG